MQVIESLVVCLALMLLVLYQCKFVHKGEISNYLSIENTTSIRGGLSVLIVLHHLSGYYTTTTFLTLFKHIGFFVVGLFFFLSGYGLMFGLRNKQGYLHGFLKRRVFKLLIPYWLANVIYVLVRVLLGEAFNFQQFVLSMVGGGLFTESGLINGPGWYIFIQIILYILFFVSYRKKHNHMLFGSLYLLLVCVLVTYGEELYWRSLLAFPLGLFWATYKEQIDNIKGKQRVMAGTLFLITMAGSGVVAMLGVKNGYDVLLGFGQFVFCACLCVVSLNVLFYFNIGNKPLYFLGKWSNQIYLMHNLALIVSWKMLSICHIRQSILAFVIFTIATIFIFVVMLDKMCGFTHKHLDRT